MKPFKDPRTGIFYFRKAVPKDLRGALGYEIKKTLETRDHKVAEAKLTTHILETDQLFALARSDFQLTPKIAQQLAGDWLRRELSKDLKLRDTSNPERCIKVPTEMDPYDMVIDQLIESYEDRTHYELLRKEVYQLANQEKIVIQANTEAYDLLLEEYWWSKLRYYKELNKRASGDYR